MERLANAVKPQRARAQCPKPRVRRRNSSESGDTLVEVLFAVVIISFAAVAILGALTTSITTSAEHRSLSLDETLVKSYTETAKNVIELRSSPTPIFAPCATVSTYDTPVQTAFSSQLAKYPSTYSVHITQVAYWNGSSFGSSCPTGSGAVNDGIQSITVTAIDSSRHVSRDLTTIVRDPAWRACYEAGSGIAC